LGGGNVEMVLSLISLVGRRKCGNGFIPNKFQLGGENVEMVLSLISFS
jgi:hypothetical protein